MQRLSLQIQNVLIAFIMACSITVLYSTIDIAWLHVELFNIPVFFVIFFIVSLFISNDVRQSFQKVLWYHKRKDKLPIWQVGIGMLFYFSQVGFIELFMRDLMIYKLDGMPLYLVFSFLNAFLATVIFQEIFYTDKKSYEYKTKSNK